MGMLFSTSPLILGVVDDLPIERIRPSRYNYRFVPGDLDDLANSIRQKGLLQPILVRCKKEDTYYEIVAGHRRYESCKKLGWRKIICHIIELDDREAFEVSLIENIQRKNLNVLEEACALKNYVSNFGRGGISDLALRIGKSISYIDKKIKLLDLPANVLDSLCHYSISHSTAEELLSLKNDKAKQSELAKLAQTNNLSSREIRELIKDIKREAVYDYETDETDLWEPKIKDIDEKVRKSFDKSIIALRIAMTRLSSVIEEMEDNWMIYELLLQHKNVLHNQIDQLIKEKMKVSMPNLGSLNLPLKLCVLPYHEEAC
jgi:ParB family transcriptional regulator, chromosome partitioning protein